MNTAARGKVLDNLTVDVVGDMDGGGAGRGGVSDRWKKESLSWNSVVGFDPSSLCRMDVRRL